MEIELINIGTELMLGRVLNTHQQWMCRQLSDLGYEVQRQVAIADAAQAIQTAVREALSRADVVITTGGLGPTSDDLTRELIAELLGKKLQLDEKVLRDIETFFSARKKQLPERTRVQAMVPEGAVVLQNENGTAPGLAMEVNPNCFRAEQKRSLLIMLPGPPRELRPMFKSFVVPLIQQNFAPAAPFICRTIRTSGIGESFVQELIADKLSAMIQRGLELGYCARVGQVDVRLSARRPDAAEIVNAACAIVENALAGNIYGAEEDEVEAMIVKMLTASNQTLALAESCTGGAIANRITNIPGASAVLLAGFVTYSNAAKINTLGVRPDTLEAHGAVSEATALEMAEGARKKSGADFGLSATGIAGPSGGTVEKPVGTVFIGLAASHGTLALRNFNPYDRATFKEVTGTQALDFLRRNIHQQSLRK